MLSKQLVMLTGDRYNLSPFTEEEFYVWSKSYDPNDFTKFLEKNSYFITDNFSTYELTTASIELKHGKTDIVWDEDAKDITVEKEKEISLDEQNSLMNIVAHETDVLDFINSYQFVSSEIVNHVCVNGEAEGQIYVALTNKNNILPGSMTGSIYHEEKAIQTFVISSNGSFIGTNIGHPKCYVNDMKLDCKTGVIDIFWTFPVADHDVKFVLTYECGMESNDLPSVNINDVIIE